MKIKLDSFDLDHCNSLDIFNNIEKRSHTVLWCDHKAVSEDGSSESYTSIRAFAVPNSKTVNLDNDRWLFHGPDYLPSIESSGTGESETTSYKNFGYQDKFFPLAFFRDLNGKSYQEVWQEMIMFLELIPIQDGNFDYYNEADDDAVKERVLTWENSIIDGQDNWLCTIAKDKLYRFVKAKSMSLFFQVYIQNHDRRIPDGLGEELDEQTGSTSFSRHFIRKRRISGFHFNTVSLFAGKKLVKLPEADLLSYFRRPQEIPVEFEVGMSEEGPITLVADPELRSSSVSDRLQSVYFHRNILLDYYKNYPKWKVSADSLCSENTRVNFWAVTQDSVVVPMKELDCLNYKHKINWKSFNTQPTEGSFHSDQSIGGYSSFPDNYYFLPEFALRHSLKNLSTKSNDIFGAPIFKPLQENDLKHLWCLHTSIKGEIEELGEQMHSLDRIFMESIDVDLIKSLPGMDKLVENYLQRPMFSSRQNKKSLFSIDRLECLLIYLEVNSDAIEEQITWVRKARNMRNKLSGHRKSTEEFEEYCQTNNIGNPEDRKDYSLEINLKFLKLIETIYSSI